MGTSRASGWLRKLGLEYEPVVEVTYDSETHLREGGGGAVFFEWNEVWYNRM